MCTEAINVLEPPAFDAESQYFISLFDKISWLCQQQPQGDDTLNDGCKSSPTGHDFVDNFIKYVLILHGSNCWLGLFPFSRLDGTLFSYCFYGFVFYTWDPPLPSFWLIESHKPACDSLSFGGFWTSQEFSFTAACARTKRSYDFSPRCGQCNNLRENF